jgi:actin cytoskeleton-regulatory complex protein PAN1
MYSSSNSFLGSANSARSGQSPFGQQPGYGQFPQGQQQQPLQQSNLAPQVTGYPGGQIVPQFTAIPGVSPQQGFGAFAQQQQQLQQPPSQLQPQFTAYQQGQPQQLPFHQQQQQQQQQQLPPPQQQYPPQASIPAPNQPPSSPPKLVPQKTSAQIAQSFQAPSSSAPKPPPNISARIPNIRLSFITAQDQAKFEQLFKTATGDSQTLDGEPVRKVIRC